MICQNCKKEISDHANFCTYCAAKVVRAAVPAAPVKYCTECGNAIAADARFCTHCGAKAEMHAPPAAGPVIPAAELEPIAPAVEAEAPVSTEPAAPEFLAALDSAAAPETAPAVEPEAPVSAEPAVSEYIAALDSIAAAAPATPEPPPAVPEAPPVPPAAAPPAAAPGMPPRQAGGKKRKGLTAVWIAAGAVLVAAGIAVGLWVIRPMLDKEDDRADTRRPSASDAQLADDPRPEDPASDDAASGETPEPSEAPAASAEPETPEEPAASQLPDRSQKPQKSEKPETPEPEPEPEPVPDPSPVLKLDPAAMDSYMAGQAPGAIWAFAVMDAADGALVGSARMDEALSSSALLDIPILYAVAAMHQDGTLDLDAPVRINRVTAGRTVLSGRVGQTLPLQDLLCYMLQYSDNTASNALMEYLTFQTINEVCNGRGYASVSLNNYILSTTDYTQNDNYVSCADLCGMLRELYSDQFPGIGGDFLRQNMVIQDSAAASGIGKVAPAGAVFLNLNGQKTDKYNEAAIVDDGTRAYIVAFMASHVSMDRLTAAAQTCGEYVFGTLELK